VWLLPITLTFFLCNDAATTELYPLSLHDALPIFDADLKRVRAVALRAGVEFLDMLEARLVAEPLVLEAALRIRAEQRRRSSVIRSEEHTSELQSRENLVCRLLLEKKKSRKPDAQH